MNQPASLYSKTSSNATHFGNIYLSTSTGNDPRQGWRIPLNNIIYSEQRDEETGYGYFGARYMDHELMTMWLSVDPLTDKYPSMSPYNYCAWNPVKLVDLDGMESSTHTDRDGYVVAVFNDGDNGVYRHNGDRTHTETELKQKYSKNNTSAGGIRMGVTKYWDEFMTHDGHSGNAKKNRWTYPFRGNMGRNHY